MSAESQYQQAEGKINRFLFKDYEGAMELFEAAAVRFKFAKDYNRAGEAYIRASDCAVKCKNKLIACQAHAKAVNAYMKTDLNQAAQILDAATALQIDSNKLSDAAKLEEEFAEALCKVSRGMEAIPHYEKATQYFSAENMKYRTQACMAAMAKIYGENDMFDKALALYEEVGNMAADGSLPYQAKEFFFRAMLCRFAIVTDDNRLEKGAEALEALETYMARDKYLKNTRETEFLQMCAEAVEGADMNKFDAAVSLLNDLHMLDEWKSHVLLVVKKNIESIR
ncbi:soluble N-ethylmaleimide sensitive factor (NSF) attachment protein [Trypanosoma rangeli]|uniref:Soluble N-ethylmaleimide sensitive factor (NSF) attachment protein n=1 Tax=Trypanosoma rangeli TaxID=5698 RepID=A0A3S5IRU0_TRYRA|nr:soluble N-ethylmaleimide sensitive factor (NSF) attachment protein [Trypanosoma rangeli]RNF08810.1 soluble N-ethylmaleimide sensitive factor (NSF) attachment protein [Trypanosoma rangeli]|eukprot:RNF08810.1 soluble N-ethylmaleimide sensitive factor (NSF) attachment protein [Trypanosoma rangeli]